MISGKLVGKNINISIKIDQTETILEKTIGLIGSKKLPQGRGLLLQKCRFIHSFFMTFPIDVIYLDRNYCVVGTKQSMSPNRLSGCFSAFYTLELASGEIDRLGVVNGQVFEWH